jgi:elongin-A
MVRSIPYACGIAALEFSRPMGATVFPRASGRSRLLSWVISPSEAMEASVLRRSLLPRLKVDLTCWQDLRAKKEKRLEEISARMKRQRLEAEERKKQKEIKITDCVPPMKRARGCEFLSRCLLEREEPYIRVSGPVSPQQKSLFQKTRSEASKIQRTMFEPRMRLPMPASHTNRQRVQSVISSSSSLIHPTSGTRVIVRPVPVGQRPTESPGSPSAGKKTTTNVQNRPQGSQPLDPTAREKQTSVGAKKEPSCSLFMPKHRAHSQLTSRLVPSHASPTR